MPDENEVDPYTLAEESLTKVSQQLIADFRLNANVPPDFPTTEDIVQPVLSKQRVIDALWPVLSNRIFSLLIGLDEKHSDEVTAVMHGLDQLIDENAWLWTAIEDNHASDIAQNKLTITSELGRVLTEQMAGVHGVTINVNPATIGDA